MIETFVWKRELTVLVNK